MDNIYLTNEVANILDVSIGTVRNYAKSLERAGHEFEMRKQARVWTNNEIQLINEVQEFYHEYNYTLDQSFMYVVALHQKGKEYADDLLNDFIPTSFTAQQPTPQLEYLEGIKKDAKTLISRFDAFELNIATKDDLQTLRTDIETMYQLQNKIDNLKRENENLTHENQKMLQEKNDLQKQIEELKNETQKVKQMTTFEFWKYKKE